MADKERNNMPDLSEIFTEGEELVEKGEPQAALNLLQGYNEQIQGMSADVQLDYNLLVAETLFNLTKYHESLLVQQQSLGLMPQVSWREEAEPLVYFRIALINFRLHRYADALPWLKKALINTQQLPSHTWPYHWLMARCYLGLESYPEALEAALNYLSKADHEETNAALDLLGEVLEDAEDYRFLDNMRLARAVFWEKEIDDTLMISALSSCQRLKYPKLYARFGEICLKNQSHIEELLQSDLRKTTVVGLALTLPGFRLDELPHELANIILAKSLWEQGKLGEAISLLKNLGDVKFPWQLTGEIILFCALDDQGYYIDAQEQGERLISLMTSGNHDYNLYTYLARTFTSRNHYLLAEAIIRRAEGVVPPEGLVNYLGWRMPLLTSLSKEGDAIEFGLNYLANEELRPVVLKNMLSALIQKGEYLSAYNLRKLYISLYGDGPDLDEVSKYLPALSFKYFDNAFFPSQLARKLETKLLEIYPDYHELMRKISGLRKDRLAAGLILIPIMPVLFIAFNQDLLTVFPPFNIALAVVLLGLPINIFSYVQLATRLRRGRGVLGVVVSLLTGLAVYLGLLHQALTILAPLMVVGNAMVLRKGSLRD